MPVGWRLHSIATNAMPCDSFKQIARHARKAIATAIRENPMNSTQAKHRVIGLAFGLAALTNASAATLSTFHFDTQWTQNPALAGLYPAYSLDYRLESVSHDSKTVSNFQFVNSAAIVRNDYDDTTGADASGFVRQPYYVINTGRGANTAIDPWVNEGPTSGAGGATAADLVATYANLNLNSLNYNRERGDYGIFTISFAQPTDTFYIFERGRDSDIHLDALDASGNTVGHWDFLRTDGYGDTGVTVVTETGFPGWPTTGAQSVGSVGIKVVDGVATTLKFTIHAVPDFGPDLKVFGGAPVVAVPEPASVLTLGAGGLALLGWRRRQGRVGAAAA